MANGERFSDSRIRYFLGDVRDRERLARAFKDVNYIAATAAKIVPRAEYDPFEYVKTSMVVQ